VVRESIRPEDYRAFQAYLEELSGILLGENKQYLVHSRLHRLLREHAIGDLGELVRRLRREPRSALGLRVVEAMTTNETFWFRDGHPFDLLMHTVLPAYVARRARSLRIWSAACSSGQEPYSISMVVEELLATRPGAFPGGVGIVATDIAPQVLEEARQGVYEGLAISRGLSPARRDRFFVRRGEAWQVRPEVRGRVTFRAFNLAQGFAPLGRFDVIFCRNVLIYFSPARKQDILARLAAALNPGGYLFLGASETLSGLSDAFEMVRGARGVVFRLREAHRPGQVARAAG
jgi:chemotaxis protein methyltransferase CheR